MVSARAAPTAEAPSVRALQGERRLLPETRAGRPAHRGSARDDSRAAVLGGQANNSLDGHFWSAGWLFVPGLATIPRTALLEL